VQIVFAVAAVYLFGRFSVRFVQVLECLPVSLLAFFSKLVGEVDGDEREKCADASGDQRARGRGPGEQRPRKMGGRQ
jgi:hypothetical protein